MIVDNYIIAEGQRHCSNAWHVGFLPEDGAHWKRHLGNDYCESYPIKLAYS